MVTVTRLADGGERGIGIDMAGAGAIAQLTDRVLRHILDLVMRTRLVVAGMTACAIAQLRNRISHGSRTGVLGVWPGFEVARMTTRAVRPIRCIAPGGRIGVGGVTTDAGQAQTCIVIPRVLTGGMHKSQWRPPGGGMAHIAIARGGHVASVLAGGRSAVVTTETTTGNAGMAEGRRCPRQC